MKINISSAQSKKTDFIFSQPAAGLELAAGETEAVFLAPITIQAKIDCSGKKALVSGTITAKVQFPCSRCLADYNQVLVVPFTFFCQPENGHGPLAAEDTDDIILYNPGTGVIDIAERVREQIILALPLKPLCNQDCRGLCPECGANLNKQECSCSKKKK